jgi:hypothetical protein
MDKTKIAHIGLGVLFLLFWAMGKLSVFALVSLTSCSWLVMRAVMDCANLFVRTLALYSAWIALLVLAIEMVVVPGWTGVLAMDYWLVAVLIITSIAGFGLVTYLVLRWHNAHLFLRVAGVEDTRLYVVGFVPDKTESHAYNPFLFTPLLYVYYLLLHVYAFIVHMQSIVDHKPVLGVHITMCVCGFILGTLFLVSTLLTTQEACKDDLAAMRIGTVVGSGPTRYWKWGGFVHKEEPGV